LTAFRHLQKLVESEAKKTMRVTMRNTKTTWRT
jgi:hypothetical protein